MESNKLTRKDYMKATLRSYLLQSAFNYSSYQGVGYSYVIYPALKKIYANNPEKLKEVVNSNMDFYNTNPHTLPFATSVHLAMYDNDESIENGRNIKMALMGPLAGIGDSIAQFGVAPLFSTIFAGFALDGLAIAPIGFFLAINLTLFALKLFLGDMGYRLGTTMVDTLSSQINKISEAASIVGVTVIAGLATNFVRMNIGLEYSTTLETGEEQLVAIQTIFDQMSPKLLPFGLTLVVFYLIKKKGWSTYKVLILLFVIGILGSITGILV